MSDDHEKRLRDLEIGQATMEKTIEGIEDTVKTGMENHRKDIKELFSDGDKTRLKIQESQEQTRLDFQKGINTLHASLPCASNSTKIEEIQKKVNGTDIKGMKTQVDANKEAISKVETQHVNTQIESAGIKGGAKTLDYVYKLIVGIIMLVLAVLAYKNNNSEEQVKEAKPVVEVREESMTPNP